MATITATHTFYLTSYDSSKKNSYATVYTGSYAPTVVLNKSSAASGSRAQFSIRAEDSPGTFGFLMELDNSFFPSNAVITSCVFSIGIYCSNANNSYTHTKNWTFTWGNYTISQDTWGTGYSSAVKSYTMPDVSDITIADFTGNIDLLLSYGNSNNSSTIYMYGAQLVVTYEYEAAGDTLYLKNNSGVWVPVTKIFRKENDVWVEKTTSVLDDNNISQLIIG